MKPKLHVHCGKDFLQVFSLRLLVLSWELVQVQKSVSKRETPPKFRGLHLQTRRESGVDPQGKIRFSFVQEGECPGSGVMIFFSPFVFG